MKSRRLRISGAIISAMGSPDTGVDEFAVARRAMVEDQIRKRGIASPRVLDAMLSVPRHEFVPGEFRADAYADKPFSPRGEPPSAPPTHICGAVSPHGST